MIFINKRTLSCAHKCSMHVLKMMHGIPKPATTNAKGEINVNEDGQDSRMVMILLIKMNFD